MPVLINDIPITPAPLVTFGKTYVSNAGKGRIGAEYNIVLNGNLLAIKGNPVATGVNPSVFLASGTPYTSFSVDDDPLNTSIQPDGLLNSIMKKQEYLREVLALRPAESGVKLEIIAFNENKGIKAYCLVDDIQFDDQSRWTNTCGYAISLRAFSFTESANGLFSNDSSEDSFSYYVSEADSSWTVQESEAYTATSGNYLDQKKTYVITHSASAVGQRVITASGSLDPISQASGYVHNIIGLGSGFLPNNFLGLTGNLSIYNRKIVENINNFTGSYSVDEEFTLGPSGQPATEQISISVDNDLGSLTRIQINGTITGFNSSGIKDRSSNSYTNASIYWTAVSGTLYNIANSFLESGNCSLNTIPVSRSVGRNLQEGVITYSYSYDNRPANFITNALTEDIQIIDTYPGQNINIVPVIGRSQPIIQYLNSRSEYKRGLQITANMPVTNCQIIKPTREQLSAIFEFYKPVGTKIYYGPPVENFNPKTGQYSYSIEFIFEGPSLSNNY